MRRRRRALATTAFLPLLAAPLAREEALPPSRHQHLCVPWTASLREALTRSNAFLPDPAAFVSHPPVDAAAERLRRQLRRLGESCRAPFLPIGGTNAFGSLVNALVLPLKFAVASNRTMLTPPLGAYANGSCATLACFYRPLAPACERANGYPAPVPGPRPRPSVVEALAVKQERRRRAKRCQGAAAAPRCDDYEAIARRAASPMHHLCDIDSASRRKRWARRRSRVVGVPQCRGQTRATRPHAACRRSRPRRSRRSVSTLHLRRMRLRGAFGLSRSSLRAFLQRLVTCAQNLMLVATQAFAPAERRDTAPRRPPRGGGGPAASAAAASRHSRSARRLVPRGAGGDQGASVFALCRVLVPRTRHAGARRRSSIHLSSKIFAAGALRHPVRIPRNRRSLRRRRGSDSGHNRRSAALRHARQSAGQRRHRTAPTLGFSARPCQTQFAWPMLRAR